MQLHIHCREVFFFFLLLVVWDVFACAIYTKYMWMWMENKRLIQELDSRVKNIFWAAQLDATAE